MAARAVRPVVITANSDADGMASASGACGRVVVHRWSRREESVAGPALLAGALLECAALAAQAGQCGAGCVRQPARRGDELVQRGSLFSSKQASDQRLLGAGPQGQTAGL